MNSEKTNKCFIQFIKFCIVGVSNTLVSYAINILVLSILRKQNLQYDYLMANIVAFILSVLWSFFWNNKYVFRENGASSGAICTKLLKTYVAYGFTGIILNNILSWLWIEMFDISKYIAPLMNLVISVPLNFVMNKLWAFKDQK